MIIYSVNFTLYHDGYAKLTSRNEENFELIKSTMKKYFEMFENPVTAMCFDLKL